MRPLALAPATFLVMSAALAALHAQAAQPSAGRPALDGAWTLQKGLSDKPPAGEEGRREGRDGRDGGHRGGGQGGGRGGGFGGGFGGQGSGGGRGEGRSPEDVQRLRNALRDELEAPEHLTIVESGSTIILTAGDGRTTRLSADGKKIKDESTGVERRTKWEAGKLVSEISGLGQGKILETYALDAEHKQLHVRLDLEGPQRKATVSRTYDADPR
jgi:hypothetical protein